MKDIRAYLLKSVKNSCIKIISRDPIQFEKLQMGIETKLVEEIDPEEVLIGKELDQFLEEAIESLSPQCQLVFNMVRLQNKKYNDVANELGISVNTVRNLLVSALKHIRKRIETSYDEHPIIRFLPKIGSIIPLLASGLYSI
ncbi:MAG: RNA polymerase sigma factor [Bacteroidota bacterium]